MTLRNLEIFVSVCECGTTVKAAEQLHITQPSISTAIQEMEKNYDVILFNRVNQRLVLTEDGRSLFQRAKQVLTSFNDFESYAEKKKENKCVKIGSTLTIGKTLLPELLSKTERQFPDISPYVKISKASDIESALLMGNIDFALVEGEPDSSGIEKISFSKDSLSVICGNQYRISDYITLENLSKHKLIVREKGSASRNLLEDTFKSYNLTFTPYIESQSNEAIISLVEENLGVAAIPHSLVKKEISEKSLREISVEGISFARDFYLIKCKNKKMNAYQQKIFEYVLNNISN